MNAKKGIKIFLERAIADMFKEYTQLDDVSIPTKQVVAPFNPDGLTPLDRNKTLESVNLIKEKCCGNIKGRTCENGSKQRNYLKLDESVSSPTCSTKSLMETLVIYAMEKIYVAIFYVPGAFLTSEMYKEFLMVLRCRLEELMVKSDLIIYQKFVTVENVHTALFIQMQK